MSADDPSGSSVSAAQVVDATRCWIETVVVGQNFCPFAAAVLNAEAIHYGVVTETQIELSLHALISQVRQLDENDGLATSLVIFSRGFAEFETFLELLALAEDLLIAEGYEGIYQLASFHPRYQFAGSQIGDAANYTNRSPYPTLHLLREDAVAAAIASHPDIDAVPRRNIDHATAMGASRLAAVLASCYRRPL